MNTTHITWRNYSILITIAFAFLLFFINCEGETSTVQVTTPEIKGTLPTNRGTAIVQKPIYIPTGTIGIPKIPTNSENTDTLSSMLQVYKDEFDFAVDRFAHEKDSLQRLIMFQNAISLKSFTTKFEDEFLKLEMEGIVSGELKELTPHYTIKPKKIDVKIPGVKFRLLAGGGFGINKELNQTLYKANLGYQVKSGNIYRLSYLNVNNQTYGVLEVDFPLFTIRK